MAENVPRTSSQFSNNDRLNLSETEKQIFSEIESFCKNRRACFFERFSMPTVNSCKALVRKSGSGGGY